MVISTDGAQLNGCSSAAIAHADKVAAAHERAL